MKSADMLTALSTNASDNDPEGIFYMHNSQLLAFTGIRIDSTNNLVLYRENKKPNLTMKEFLTTLMKNKKLALMYLSGAESQNIYGFRMENRKIII
ncbi:hypothetical protein [Enterococcus pallens]|uniref:Uncharacterized protein n=1 Tax=Enterococcus pallens ATCC BAA-351 TaxID=1158607 RepID=R2SMM0_9ENTE|nr:hypothetical protein [Enterococcus pallens]EOH96405.1 hypothetical protein UAU_01056 [Enterococcus pallens ATCC BAA-351]EOU14382.1 hypothetical protein I588_04738 [Enterococcus pallens ATCC BAA-351]